MIRSLARLSGAGAALIATAVLALLASSAPASTPPSQQVPIPAAPGSKTVTWTGTLSPGAGPASDCNLAPPGDSHTIDLQVPAGFYGSAQSSATFTISWDDPANDEVLTVNAPDGSTVGSSDGSNNSEVVSASNLKGGKYEVLACNFLATTPQDYTGTFTVTTIAGAGEPSMPAADAKGLAFSASVPADPQRDEAEPLMHIDRDGNIYGCGPTGFSGASDYAQVSTDGGDQFHLLGEEPRGQQGLGGGGDCGLASGVSRNADGNYQYAYAGLGPLTGFTTSTSADNGHNIQNAGPQGNTNTAQGGGADRQWLTFLDDHTVLLNYNQQQPRNIVVQKSTDGGLTYLPGNDTISSPNPDFPGPMGSMPARLVDPNAGAHDYVAYYGWNSSDADNSYVNFAISDETGLNWHNCLVKKIPLTDSGGLGAFTVADNDNAGNIYLTYSDEKAFHTYLTTLTHDKLAGCSDGTTTQPTTDPGWSTPVQVDREGVRTTVFPWLAAGGDPGRVAIAFYGTKTDGDPNGGDFKASWDVYVNQSLNALSANPAVSQVKATTHPFHYDSICLLGLACDLSQPPGDRSLADFFAIDYNPVSDRLSVIYDQGAKMPDEAAGHVATPMVITQQGGPSNGGSTVTEKHPVLADRSVDHKGDALADYSNLSPLVAGPDPRPTNVPALDLLSQKVGKQTDPATGKELAAGGFDVTLKLADLSRSALQGALTATKSQSLLWIFRFVNGYQASAASARWSPAQGFTFGFNDYTTGSAQCGSDGEKCQLFPGNKKLEGSVDRTTGTITLSVPRAYLRGLSGGTGPFERPAIVKAAPGTRFYDATAFTLGNVSPDPATQSFLYPIDNPPAMDFLLPAAGGTGGGGGGGGGSGGGGAPGAGCSNLITGTPKADRIKGTPKADRIKAGAGNDRLSGRRGNDCLSGAGGRDRAIGGGGRDLIKGSGSRDRLRGGGGGDALRGGTGRDRIVTGGGKDVVVGGGGNDLIRVRGGGVDRVDCGPGRDTVSYSKHVDKLRRCEIKRSR